MASRFVSKCSVRKHGQISGRRILIGFWEGMQDHRANRSRLWGGPSFGCAPAPGAQPHCGVFLAGRRTRRTAACRLLARRRPARNLIRGAWRGRRTRRTAALCPGGGGGPAGRRPVVWSRPGASSKTLSAMAPRFPSRPIPPASRSHEARMIRTVADNGPRTKSVPSGTLVLVR